MRFTHPHVLWFLFLVPALFALHLLAQARRHRLLVQLTGPVLGPRLVRGFSPARRHLKTVLALMALTCLIVACSRPRFGSRLEEVHRRGLDLVVALDVSKSMLAEDIQPTRLTKAKAEIEALIERLGGDQIGLVAFAGTAFLQCPLTTDYAAATTLLDALGPEMLPVPGTAIGEAIKVATEAFATKELKYRVVILVTDGEDTVGDPLKSAREAAQKGVKIYTIGLGRTDGAPIPVRDATGAVVDHKKDARGQAVHSRLNARLLEGIAAATGGRFYQATREEGELESILKEIQTLERRELKAKSILHMEDRFQPLVLLALILLVAELLIPERSRESAEWGGRFA
ncbi:MAG: VWA domain-containing protein [Candidatus Riflebacteria bacterium]|nr:VWA domain-containing protein [Candidatus Riflebacteria bacterium]